MKKSRFSEEQIAYALRMADGGTPVVEVCRQIGISEATFYTWKKKYGELGVSELRKLRQLEDENVRLRRIVADLTLDKQILQEVVKKKLWGLPSAASWQPGCRGVSGSACAARADWRCCSAQAGTPRARHGPRVRCASASGTSR